MGCIGRENENDYENENDWGSPSVVPNTLGFGCGGVRRPRPTASAAEVATWRGERATYPPPASLRGYVRLTPLCFSCRSCVSWLTPMPWFLSSHMGCIGRENENDYENENDWGSPSVVPNTLGFGCGGVRRPRPTTSGCGGVRRPRPTGLTAVASAPMLSSSAEPSCSSRVRRRRGRGSAGGSLRRGTRPHSGSRARPSIAPDLPSARRGDPDP